MFPIGFGLGPLLLELEDRLLQLEIVIMELRYDGVRLNVELIFETGPLLIFYGFGVAVALLSLRRSLSLPYLMQLLLLHYEQLLPLLALLLSKGRNRFFQFALLALLRYFPLPLKFFLRLCPPILRLFFTFFFSRHFFFLPLNRDLFHIRFILHFLFFLLRTIMFRCHFLEFSLLLFELFDPLLLGQDFLLTYGFEKGRSFEFSQIDQVLFIQRRLSSFELRCRLFDIRG